MRNRLVLAAAATLIGGGALIAAVDGGRGDVGSTNARTRTASDSPNLADGATSFATGGGSGDQASPVEQAGRVPAAESRVVKTAQLELSVSSGARVTNATERVNHIAEAHGGFIASTDASKGDHRQTTITLRVPVDRYDAALTELRRLGKVTSETLGGRDVTSTLVDLDARLRTLRAQEAALNALVSKARTVGETLEVAREAANVRMQIEQLAAQQAQLADQADFATISLHIFGPGVASEKDPKPQPLLLDSAERAVAATLAVFGGTIILLGYVVPSALLAAIGYGLWRLVRGRRVATEGAAVAS